MTRAKGKYKCKGCGKFFRPEECPSVGYKTLEGKDALNIANWIVTGLECPTCFNSSFNDCMQILEIADCAKCYDQDLFPEECSVQKKEVK
jgi:hypothetical protein